MLVGVSIPTSFLFSPGIAPQAIGKTNENNSSPHNKNKTEGYVLKMHTRGMGLASCKITRDAFLWESSMLAVAADRPSNMITMGDQQTRKSFSFPSEKFRYYISLMGFSEFGDSGNVEFKRRYKFSEWKRKRAYKIEDLDLVEYERHVTNPPPGRTRTQFISVVNFPGFPSRFTSIYNEVTRVDAGAPPGLVAVNKTVVTNPDQMWVMVSLDGAKKTMLSQEEVKLDTKQYKKVTAMSELFVQEKSKKDPLDELREK